MIKSIKKKVIIQKDPNQKQLLKVQGTKLKKKQIRGQPWIFN